MPAAHPQRSTAPPSSRSLPIDLLPHAHRSVLAPPRSLVLLLRRHTHTRAHSQRHWSSIPAPDLLRAAPPAKSLDPPTGATSLLSPVPSRTCFLCFEDEASAKSSSSPLPRIHARRAKFCSCTMPSGSRHPAKSLARVSSSPSPPPLCQVPRPASTRMLRHGRRPLFSRCEQLPP